MNEPTNPKVKPLWAYILFVVFVNGAVVFAAPDWPYWRQVGVALLIVFAMNFWE